MSEEEKGGDMGAGFAELVNEMAKAHRKFEDEHGKLELSSEFEFPMEISTIMLREMPSTRGGKFVRVRPISDEKTYFGIYMGDMHREVMIARGSKSKALMLTVRSNPAIWVPDLEKIVWGDSSWWAEITTAEEAKKLISDEDIQNIWYVQALKRLSEKEDGGDGVVEKEGGKS